MWWIILIASFIIFGVVVFILYTIGKRVKADEKKFEEMFNEHKVKQKLVKYKRKNTPKVPTKKYIHGKKTD